MGEPVTEKLDEDEYREEMRRFGKTPDGDRIESGNEEEESEPDESGLPSSSPEQVTDDDLFSERDFEGIDRAVPPDDDPFWEVEDSKSVEDEEAAPRKTLRDPGEPSKQEWEEHRVDHIPYRSWCPYCVRGRGTGTQHRRRSEVPKVPIFGFDYLHGTEGAEGEDATPIKILVAKCHLTKCLFAHVVPQKGMDPENYSVERLKRDILWLGHTKVILKSDNEQAILALLRNTLKSLRVEHLESTQEAHPAAYDPSSDASVEVACKTVGGLVSTIRSCLEARMRRKIGVQHCAFAWLVEHAAWVHTIRMRQSDGITAYQRLRGMSFGLKLVGFGESCLYQVPK